MARNTPVSPTQKKWIRCFYSQRLNYKVLENTSYQLLIWSLQFLQIFFIRDLSTDNLQYLSSSQAIDDIAAFIRGMKKKHEPNQGSKWIVFGGSYPGSLTVWLRSKYPELVYGGVSSSGPLLAKLNFKG